MARFLCDNCKYDHPNACSNPERPNATKCKDYKSSGGENLRSLSGFAGITGQWTLKKVFFLIIALIVIIGIVLLFVLPY